MSEELDKKETGEAAPETAREVITELLGDDSTPQNPNISTVPVIPQLSVALGLLVLVFSLTYVGATRSLSEEREPDPAYVTAEPTIPVKGTVPITQTFENIELEAESAIVWDIQNQRALFNKNADDVRPLASITKLMTALVAYELLDPDEQVNITLDALRVSGDSGFSDGEAFTAQNLADLVLIESSNDGATALGARAGEVIAGTENPEAAFITAMNLRAEELGLTKTRFKNATGLDISETEAGAYGSARDIARLMDYIITNVPDTVALTNLEVTTIPNADGKYYVAKNTNEAVKSTPGLIASKTGYTTLSGGNLAVAVNAGLNRPIVVVVLGSSYEGRFTDTGKLIERTLQALGKQ